MWRPHNPLIGVIERVEAMKTLVLLEAVLQSGLISSLKHRVLFGRWGKRAATSNTRCLYSYSSRTPGNPHW
jgi:hypothetical protein